MVIPCSVHAVGTAGTAGATALGLGLGKSEMELSRDLFVQQMRQTKRLWTADWAEASIRHGEQIMQAAQQHSEAQALAAAAYYQAEKLASQELKLARDQDSRAYEMSWRAEVREAIRDELSNENSRFNTIMLCDTVCLGCMMGLVSDGSPPEDTPFPMLVAYVFCLGFSIMLFSISLWGAVIVVRRLYDNTAARLERKLFAQSEDLQTVWKEQLESNTPTGTKEMYLITQAYESWVAEHLNPIGRMSINMLSIGVVTMFVAAGIFVHNHYLIELKSPISIPIIFWVAVIVTSVTVIAMKGYEDRIEKRKEGVYDISWQDEKNKIDPFDKISKAVEELSSPSAVHLASTSRMDNFGRQENQERNYCVNTKSLHQRVESLRNDAEARAKTRREVLNILTTATEELDALPEELTSRLNKMLHRVDDADARTANLMTQDPETVAPRKTSYSELSRMRYAASALAQRNRAPLTLTPMDAQRIPVSLGNLRSKLGEIPITTLVRIRNTSDEPIRLKSGMKLDKGRYIKSLTANDPNGNGSTYVLYPPSEIQPRSEVVIAARSAGGWVATSGIQGRIVYTNRDGSWNFSISFRNSLVGNVRRCRVDASRVMAMEDDSASLNQEEKEWHVSKEVVDRKTNNEVLIRIDSQLEQLLTTANNMPARREASESISPTVLKQGMLMQKQTGRMGLQWEPRFFTLTPHALLHGSSNKNQRSQIPLNKVQRITTDKSTVYVFDIHLDNGGTQQQRQVIRLKASSQKELEDWIQKLRIATGISLGSNGSSTRKRSTSRSSLRKKEDEDVYDILEGVECVRHGDDTVSYAV